MLFKYLEEVTMPNLNHCIDCDKPMQPANSKGLCDSCYLKATRLRGWIEDYEPTTADKYNKEWLDEQKTRTETKTQ